jgi:C4-dicarboxylate-specific signal transduction histidine kinase
VQPFTNRQITLFTDFAAQATIALESTRRERQLRELQAELAHANRVATLGQLSASIAHEVKQPIGSAVTNAQAALRLLGRQPPDLETVREALEDIVEGGQRAGDVLDRLRALITKAPARKERLDINQAIRKVSELAHGEAVKNCVSVQMGLADDLPLIEGDRVQLQQVIMNLIVNAIQAMRGFDSDRRELHIRTDTIGAEGVRVVVQDNGPGLTPESLPRLFEPFYTTKADGMGMGLAICRSIIEAHGGRLWAAAREPHGALFQFTIPAEPATTS